MDLDGYIKYQFKVNITSPYNLQYKIDRILV